MPQNCATLILCHVCCAPHADAPEGEAPLRKKRYATFYYVALVMVLATPSPLPKTKRQRNTVKQLLYIERR